MPRDLFEKVVPRGKPVFIDRRFATSSQNAARMRALARPAGIPLMSGSSRPCPEAFAMGLAHDSKGAAVGVDVFGLMAVETAALGLFWYGIHGMDMVLRAANREGSEAYAMNGRMGVWLSDTPGSVCPVPSGGGRPQLPIARRGASLPSSPRTVFIPDTTRTMIAAQFRNPDRHRNRNEIGAFCGVRGETSGLAIGINP